MLRSYENIPKGKAQINFKVYDKPEMGKVDWRKKNFCPEQSLRFRFILCTQIQLKIYLHVVRYRLKLARVLSIFSKTEVKRYFKSSANTEAEYFGVLVYSFCGEYLSERLLAAIGAVYGGAGSTNLKVPDFRRMFLRVAG